MSTEPKVGAEAGNPNPGSAPEAGNLTDWRAGLDESLRGEKFFESIPGKDWAEAGPKLAKVALDSQRYAGGAVRIPKDDAKPEEWNEYYKKLGRPDKPEEYGIKAPEEFPEGAWDDQRAASFQQKAHELGLSKKQAAALADWNAGWVRDQIATRAVEMKGSVDKLREEWGPNFERNVELARRAAKQLGGDGFLGWLDETGHGNHPHFVRVFSKMGAKLGEAQLVQGDLPGESKTSAQAKINAILGDKKHAYHDRRHPGNKAALEEMAGLYKVVYGNE